MRSCTLLLALAAAHATRWLSSAARGGSTLTSRKLFATEELEHPLRARGLPLRGAGARRKRAQSECGEHCWRSQRHKTVKFVDGRRTAIKMGASAASGATVAEARCCCKGRGGAGPASLSASAACRARMALEALEAWRATAPTGAGRRHREDVAEACGVWRRRGGREVCHLDPLAERRTKLVTALDADACDIVTPDFSRRARPLRY